jgi:1-acyl-sn-glycerol-3-phosphate acyltransferase
MISSSNEYVMPVGGFGHVMFTSLIRCWRVFGTGLSFLAVGIGGVFVFPVLNIVIRSRELRSVIARHVVRLTFRSIVGLMRVMGVFRYEINGLERLERHGLLILANHPTLIDIVFLMAFVRRADCIVKSKLWRNPFTHATVRAAAYVRNDDYGVQLIEDCVAAVRGGGNLIIFPEGTRTPTNGSITLKRGAANIALRARCNVTPVFIRCVPPMLVKGKRWWRLPSRPSHYSIEVQEDIDIQPFIVQAGSDALAARRLTDHLQSHFVQEKARHGVG